MGQCQHGVVIVVIGDIFAKIGLTCGEYRVGKIKRQFVADASLELKTPLAVLSANLGLLETSRRGGESGWKAQKSNRRQASRSWKYQEKIFPASRRAIGQFFYNPSCCLYQISES